MDKDNVIDNQFIKDTVSAFLTSESNTFVVFDSNADKHYEGSLSECVAYTSYMNEKSGFVAYEIYSKEAYENMLNALKIAKKFEQEIQGEDEI